MKINVYCEDKRWLFEDLKQLIASYGAVPSENPIRADAYICLRTKEARKTPIPRKTVVQVHDMGAYDLSRYGCASLVHSEQKKTVTATDYEVIPIGSRDIPLGPLPAKPTIGFFCREMRGLKRSDMFEKAVLIARSFCDFDVLMIGDNLKKIAHLGEYERRPAMPDDYSRIDALVTCSISPMIPLSAYEACAAGRVVISTPREWPGNFPMVKTGYDAQGIANHIIDIVKKRQEYKPHKPFDRDNWAKRQIELARAL